MGAPLRLFRATCPRGYWAGCGCALCSLDLEPVSIRVADLENRIIFFRQFQPHFIAQQGSAMPQAIEDFGDWNLEAIRNQSHTVGWCGRFARPDVGPNMVVITAGGKEQRPRV